MKKQTKELRYMDDYELGKDAGKAQALKEQNNIIENIQQDIFNDGFAIGMQEAKLQVLEIIDNGQPAYHGEYEEWDDMKKLKAQIEKI